MDPTQGISDLETWRLALSVGLLMISAFCAHLLLLPGPFRRTRLPLGLFFLSNVFRLLALPAEHLLPGDGISVLEIALELIEVPMSMVQPFLLWLYVRRLTFDPTVVKVPLRLRWHLLPVVFACAVYLFVLAQQIALGHPVLGARAQSLQGAAVACLWAATILFYALLPVYAGLTLRRLLIYRTRLKDLYASTLGRELRWIWCLTGAVTLFWTFNLLGILAEAIGGWTWFVASEGSFYVSAFAQIALLWAIAIWGTRQQPGIRNPARAAETRTTPQAEFRKYGKSGLDPRTLARIAARIETAMTRDQLYQNPDLSLWDLADKIGAKRHYVSQALNEELGRSFFDYVNKHRVEAAKAQLRATDDSILAITYDVGFNSRSVFYRAFRDEVDMTPSQYRKSGPGEK
ncbi:AraC family transcriptional regulator [uncultured Roseobacter sp.]|uniref:helix-turn-helix transcriptional regulator n=1 Tax=uncultured Roseobacter sp. TaxID=114847 RepID=UPI0026392344|nr:AraC family transcriptional regulator [uncultured Roseobacter sp.]